MKKILIVGALAFAATSITQTASAQEVYILRDATTKKCTIVDTKPTTTTTTTIVDNGTFKDQDRSRDQHEDHEGLHNELSFFT